MVVARSSPGEITGVLSMGPGRPDKAVRMHVLDGEMGGIQVTWLTYAEMREFGARPTGQPDNPGSWHPGTSIWMVPYQYPWAEEWDL